MTNFERTVTPDFFAETLGDLLESYLCDCADCPFNDYCNSLPTEMVSGFSCANIIKKWAKAEANILDEVEKEYLRNVLKPFLYRGYKITVTKEKYFINPRKTAFNITIRLYKTEFDDCEFIELPLFHSSKMYTGMELNKEYTVEELGLR